MSTTSSASRLLASSRLRLGILAATIATVTVLAYWPGTRAPFYFDDTRIIVEDATIRWDEVSWHRARQTLEHAKLPARPVANLSLALNHAYGGLDPTGYHWTNIAIHLAVGAALAWLAWLIVVGDGKDRQWRLVAVCVAVGGFLLHPLNIQAVTYVVQRMASLAALFSLLALALYVSARRATARARRPALLRFFGAAVCFALALGSKENAATTIPVLLLYEWCFHGDEWSARIVAVWRRGTAHKAMLIAIPAVSMAAFVTVESSHMLWGAMPGRDFTGLERVLTQPRVQAWYFSVLAWPAPSRLGIEHDLTASKSLFDPWTTLPTVALAVLAVAVLGWLVWRRRYPRIVWPLASYVVFHCIESGPFSLELVFEHRMYLPLAALTVALAVALSSVRRPHRSSALSLCAAVACTLAVATHQRNRVWGDELAFWQQAVATAPNLPRVHTALGYAYAKRGRHREAVDEFRRSLALKPTAKAHYNLGNTLYLHLDQRDEAMLHLHAATKLAPRYVLPQSMLGMIAEHEGNFELAQHYLETAARLSPNRPATRANLGRLYLKQGRYADAVPELEAANRFGVKDAAAQANLGYAYAHTGRRREAIVAYKKALQIDPTNRPAVENLRMLLDATPHVP